VRLSGPGIQVGAQPAPPPSIVGQLADTLGKWANETLQAEANAERERAILDGKMAAAQGQAFDQLEMQGADKWALEGHRAMNATTTAAVLQASQQQLITDSAFALSPEEYRAQYTDQLANMVNGQDPATARMIRSRMVDVLPGLVSQHTLAYANHQEQQVFDALVQGIGPMSNDSTTAEALTSFMAGGEGSATAALSGARRSEAMVEGVVLAFAEGNPKAYGILQEADLLDDLSIDQLNRVNAANTQYQNKQRRTYSAVRQAQLSQLELDMEQGMDPTVAMNRFIDIEMQFGIEATMQEANATYSSALGSERVDNKTNALMIEDATRRKDHGALAALTGEFITFIESNNDPNALGPVIKGGLNKGDRAQGLWQVMPRTLKKPGFGVRPSNGTIEDNERVGKEYWAAMVVRYNGDLDAAAVAYNAGHVNADKWLAADKDWNVLPDRAQTEGYVKKFNKAKDAAEFPTVAERYNEAQSVLAATKKLVEAEDWEAMMVGMRQSDDAYMDGNINEPTWRGNRAALREQHDVKLTVALVNADNAKIDAMDKSLLRAAAVAQTAQDKSDLERRRALFNVAITDAKRVFHFATDAEGATIAEVDAARIAYEEEITTAAGVAGISPTGQRASKMRNGAEAQWLKASKAAEAYAAVGSDIKRHERDGNLSVMSDKHQRRAYEQATAEAVANAQSQPPDEAIDFFYEQMSSYYSRVGQIDPAFVASESSALRMLVDNDGNALPQAADALRRREIMLRADPRLADGYFDAEATALANGVMSIPTGVIEEGMVAYHNQRADRRAGSVSMNIFQAAESSQAEINNHMHNIKADQDVGLLQAWFRTDTDSSDYIDISNTELARVRSPAFREALDGLGEAALQRQKILHPFDSAQALMPAAEADVRKHTLVGGGTIVQFAQDVDWREIALPGKVNHYEKATLGHDFVLTYLQDQDVQSRYDFIRPTGIREHLPTAVRDLGDFLTGVVGFDTSLGEGLKPGDAALAGIRGVREFIVEGSVDGTKLFARIVLADGTTSAQIPIPLALAGEIYMQKFPNF